MVFFFLCSQVICSECMWRGAHRGHASEDHIPAGRNAAQSLTIAVRGARSLLDNLLARYTASSFTSGRSCRNRFSAQTYEIN